MPHVFGDHNVPILRRYTAQFDTEDGPIILECWSMEPTDAASAFRGFFKTDHPDHRSLSDKSKLAEYKGFSPEWNALMSWWRSKPVPTGDKVLLTMNPGIRIRIDRTVVEYSGSSYLTWSNASLCV